MGIISSLFGKKEKHQNEQVTVNDSEHKKESINVPSFHLKGKPDTNGLYPSELVMLSLAEHFITTETNFPSYLTYTYEIANPAKMLKSLQTKGYIEVGSAIDALDYFKLPELKEIAASLGIVFKGKKADIISQLTKVGEDSLSHFVNKRTWTLTESGKEELKANPYIQYFLEKHPYNINEVGVDIWSVNDEFVKNPKRPYKDIIYRQLNNQMNKASIAFQKDPMSGSSNAHQYCECYRMMGLFIEEEGKSFVNAADFYFQYLFKRINIYAGLQLLKAYKLFKNDKKCQAEAIQKYYDDIQLYPFHKAELLRLIDELNINGDAVKESMMTSFKRANDTGVMTEKEAADFVILELSGDSEKSRVLAEKLAKKALKKLN